MKKIIKNDAAGLSSVDQVLANLTPKQRKKFDEEHKNFLVSEMLLSIMQEDKHAAKQIVQTVKISPQAIKMMMLNSKKEYSLASFLKILHNLGCKKFKVEYCGKYLDLPIQVKSEKKPIKKNKK